MTSDHRTTGNQWVKLFFILTVLLSLIGCSSGTYAPVQERTTSSANKPSYHLVSQGETLYSIAWRYDLEYVRLARSNNLSSNYAIYPGQKIYLNRKSPESTAVMVDKKRPEKRVIRSKKEPIKTAPRKITPPKYSDFQWQWPAKGKLLAKFSSKSGLTKGIDIAGELGESVVAAGSGVVVYAGSGLRGYGNLIIIKHSDRYLSAYAHNSRILVKEQDQVSEGQKIAEIGSSGSDRNKLHFEIRRDGKPVDPLVYLPKR